jgi:hypothetical protein
MHLNILKAQQNGFVPELKPGNTVRVDDTPLFKKDTESSWSDEVHDDYYTWYSQPVGNQEH